MPIRIAMSDKWFWKVPRAVIAASLALSLMYLPVGPASGTTPQAFAVATLTVTTNADNTTDDNELTLREAILLATLGTNDFGRPLSGPEAIAAGCSAPSCSNLGDGQVDTIVFEDDFTITVDCTYSGQLPALLDNSDTIDGSGQTVTIQPEDDTCGNGITITGSNNTLRGLQIANNGGNNFGDAVEVSGSGSGNSVRPGTSGELCLLRGGSNSGLNLTGSTSSTTLVGCSVDDNEVGVRVATSGSGNVIGTSGAANANEIIDSVGHGVLVSSGSVSIVNNFIGTASNGDTELGNGDDGVHVSSGTVTSLTANTIGNNNDGVQVNGGTATVSSFTNNFIGTNAGGDDLGNANDGVEITDSSGNQTIGPGNVIGNNGTDGVNLVGGPSGHTVTGNFIGTNVTGTADLGNGENGVVVAMGSNNSTISSNTIRFNDLDGVIVTSGGTTTISGNTITTNDDDGVDLDNGATNNVTGNTAINDNSDRGIVVSDSNTGTNNINNNTVNSNDNRGIVVTGGTTNNIGTSTGNTLDNNTDGNIVVDNSAPATIQRNTIADADNASNVLVFSTGSMLIGGTGGGEGNTITGSDRDGVFVDADAQAVQILGNTFGTNDQLAIDLDGSDVTCGGADSAAPTANNGILCPVIVSADAEGNASRPSSGRSRARGVDGIGNVVGTYSEATCPTSCRIELYRATQGSGDTHGNHGHGEGTELLDSDTFTGGEFSFTGLDLTAGERLTATASTTTGTLRTSEFSANVTVLGDEVPEGEVQPDGVFTAPKKVNGGEDVYSPIPDGTGGSNAKKKKAPKVKRGGDARLIPFEIQNDGTEADSIQVESISSLSGPSLDGITITVNGLAEGDSTEELEPGEADAGNISITADSGASKGKYRVQIGLQADGDAEAQDSVTLVFRIRK